MANVSEFSIVTYLRKAGHWRAAIFPEARTQSTQGDTVRSVVTPDDFASEAEAQLAAEKSLENFDRQFRMRHTLSWGMAELTNARHICRDDIHVGTITERVGCDPNE
jgi:hypothetical protein